MVGWVDFSLLDPEGPTEGDTCAFHPGHTEAFVGFALEPWFLQEDRQI